MSTNEPHWSEQRERASLFWIQLLAWISLNLGRRFVRILLFPISLFYLVFARDAVAHSKSYLERIQPQKSGWLNTWRHIYTFACVSVDRFYIAAGRGDIFSISVEGEELLQRFAEEKRGCLILVSHAGSFEVLKQRGSNIDAEFYVLMDVQHNSAAMQVLERINPEMSKRIIDSRLNPAALALKLKEHLLAGHMVGIMADRAAEFEKQVSCDFLGGRADFPTGPWSLAYVLKVPVVMLTGFFMGKNQYRVKSQLLADRVLLPRANREHALKSYITQYSEALEEELRLAPYNWFNFYEFWNSDGSE